MGLKRCLGGVEVRRYRRPLFEVLVFLVTFSLAAYTLAKWKEFSPVYTTMGCRRDVLAWSMVKNDDGSANVSATFSNECENRNAFEVRVVEHDLGTVSLKDGTSKLAIGHCQLHGSKFLPHRKSEGWLNLEMTIPPAVIAQDDIPVQIATDLRLRTQVRLTFFGISIKFEEDLDSLCGFEALLATKEVGPMACVPASSSALIVPGLESEPDFDDSWLVSSTHLNAVADKKNLLCCFTLVVLLCIAIPSLVAALSTFREDLRMTNPNPNPKFCMSNV